MSKKKTEARSIRYPQLEPMPSLLQEPAVAAYPDVFDQIAASRRGLSKSSIFEVAALYGVTLDELSTWLHTSYRNLQRKEQNDLLDSSKTEKLLALMQLANTGKEVLGSVELFRQWIQLPILALGNKAPKEFLDTLFGIQHLIQLLGRLQWGVYS
jgi:putative toxin-antitoxin system antitoxin component (TIGR02293 family)